jgi:Condensation domain
VESSARTKAGLRVERRPADEPRVLSFGQERLWYLDQLAPGNGVYNTPLLLRLNGPLDASALHRALQSVMQRHQVLRTAFLAAGGRPVPLVPKKRAVELRQLDLRDLPEGAGEKEAARLIAEDAAYPFNLARDPMIRSLLVRLGEQEYLFLCVVHHIVFEGGSVEILFRDLAAFYNSEVTGKSPDLPELKVDYFDFASWQRRSLDDDRLRTLNAYWNRQLSGARLVDLPLDYTRPAVHTMRGAKFYFNVSPELLTAATEFFCKSGTTSYRSLCAAFVAQLHCYTGLNDVSLGTPVTPRCRGIEDLIGFFVNTVVLRVKFNEGLSFRELIRKVEVVLFGAITHSDLPLHMVVDAVQPPRDPSRTPLFQVNFRAPQTPYPRLELNGLAASPVEVLDNGTAKFDLALEVGAFVQGVSYFEYCSDLFKRETIERMAADFQMILQALIAQPDEAFSQLPAIVELTKRMRMQTAISP